MRSQNTFSLFEANIRTQSNYNYVRNLYTAKNYYVLAQISEYHFNHNLVNALNEFLLDKNLEVEQKNDANNLTINFTESYKHLRKFISSVGIESFYKINKMEANISIDEDGEIMLEWYGRKGARINLTFGRNGDLYFVSIFHGSNAKSKFNADKISYDYILKALDRLYKDKL